MAASPAVDRTSLFTAFRAGDERALEQLFRESFPAIFAEAVANAGGELVGADRALENAVLIVWRQHAELATVGAFDQALTAAVHHAAIREQSRRAGARHHEAKGGAHRSADDTSEVSADSVWGRVRGALHGPSALPSGRI